MQLPSFWHYLLVGTVPALLILLITEMFHAYRDKKARHNQLAQLFLPDRIKAAKELLRAVSDRFYDLEVRKMPEETCEAVDELIKDLHRVRIANAAVIGEDLSSAIDEFAEVLDDFKSFITVNFIEIEKVPGNWTTESLEAQMSVATIQRGKEISVLYYARDSLEKEIRKYAGFYMVDDALKKAMGIGIIERGKQCIKDNINHLKDRFHKIVGGKHNDVTK